MTRHSSRSCFALGATRIRITVVGWTILIFTGLIFAATVPIFAWADDQTRAAPKAPQGAAANELFEFSPVPPLNSSSVDQPRHPVEVNSPHAAPQTPARGVDAILGTGQRSPSNTVRARVIGEGARLAGGRLSKIDEPLNQVTFQSLPSDESQIGRPIYQQPVQQSEQPAPSRPAHEYQLKHVSPKQLESKLAATWRKRLKVQTSSDERYARAFIPGGGGTTSMLIDRESNIVAFEGDRQLVPAWQRTMQLLDRAENRSHSGVVRLVDLVTAKFSTVRQAAHLMGVVQEPERDNTIRRTIPLRGQAQDDQNQRGPIILTQPQDDEHGIVGPVRIEVIADLGIIILTGNARDVAKVERMIRDIVDTSALAQPKVKRILLKNAQAQPTAELVQEVYDLNYAATQGSASVRPILNPNGLLAIGQPESLATIENIARELDVEMPEEPEHADFKVYPLKYISAVDAKQRVDAYFGQAAQPQQLESIPPAPVTTIADYRSNILIVRASPQFIRQIDLLLKEIDVDDSPAKNMVRVFELRNALATEIQPILQDAINGQLQNRGQGLNTNPQQQGTQQQLQQPGNQLGGQLNANTSQLRSAGLELMTVDRDGQKVSGGIMFDVRVTAAPNNNALVVTGPERAMDLIAALIEQLDKIPDAETQIKVFTIVNGDAQTLLDMLNALFIGQNQGQTQGQLGGQGGQAITNAPLQSASSPDGNTLINLRFSLDARTNSIIASGPIGDLQVVYDLITRLDEEDVHTRRVSVYRLSNAPVLDVADAIQQWLDSRTTRNENDLYVSPQTRTRRDVTVVPEVVSNSLIVSALPEYFVEVEQVIRALDRRPPMVKIQCMIAEIDLRSLEEFGVDWGIQDSLLFDRGLGTVGFPFIQDGIGNNSDATALATRENLAGQLLSDVNVGRINSNLGYGGLVLSAGNESINVLIRALKNKQCLQVLNKPHITTLENLQGRVQVGSEVPRVTGVSQGAFGVQNTVEFTDVGVIIAITPRVSPDGMIVMFVDVQRSEVGDESTGIPIFVNDNGDILRSPEIIATKAQTALMARSGQTVVFSGLLQESKTHVKRGIPILSDLPAIGPLFAFESDSADRRETVIFLTPYIVDDDQDVQDQNNFELERMHWCMCDVAEMYGSLNDAHGSYAPATEVYYPDADPAGERPQILHGDFLETDPQPGQPPLEPSYPPQSYNGYGQSHDDRFAEAAAPLQRQDVRQALHTTSFGRMSNDNNQQTSNNRAGRQRLPLGANHQIYSQADVAGNQPFSPSATPNGSASGNLPEKSSGDR